MGNYVVCTHRPGGGKLWLTAIGGWTADIAEAKRFLFGRDTFATSSTVWIEFAPVVK